MSLELPKSQDQSSGISSLAACIMWLLVSIAGGFVMLSSFFLAEKNEAKVENFLLLWALAAILSSLWLNSIHREKSLYNFIFLVFGSVAISSAFFFVACATHL